MEINKIRIIEIGLLNKCNLKCPLCTRQTKTSKKLKRIEELNIVKLKEFINTFPNLIEIKLVGAVAEPTLYSKFLELIKFIKTKSICIIISTNGSTNDSKFWIELGKLLDENDEIIFAIDGSTQAIHEKYRVGSSLEKVLFNHKALKEVSNCITTGQFIKFNYNINDYENVKTLITNNNFSKFKDINCYMFDKKYDNDHYISEIYSGYQKLEKNDDKLICQTKNENFIYLNYLGEVLPCCFINDLSLTNDYNIKNINTHNINECFTDMIKMIENESCCKFFCSRKNKLICGILKLDP